MKIIDDNLLDKVSAQAKGTPRLRMNYNFHQSLDDKGHHFLYALGHNPVFFDVREYPIILHEEEGIHTYNQP